MGEAVQVQYEERLNLFHDIIRRKETHRIPIIGTASGYMLSELGYPYGETLRDWGKMQEAVVAHTKKYQWDSILLPGHRNPIRIPEALGSNHYLINEEAYSLTVRDKVVLNADEYDEIIADRKKFLWEKLMPRKYPNATKEMYVRSVQEFLAYTDYMNRIDRVLKEECGTVKLNNVTTGHAVETLFSGLRGIRGLSMDLRRHPEKVIEYCNSMTPPPVIKYLIEDGLQKSANEDCVFDVFAGFLAQTIFNNSMFEKIFMPAIDAMVDTVVQNDKTMVLFMEGDNTRLWDFFKDLPRGHFALWLEQDNLFEAKKVMGDNVTLVGGFPVDLLANGTKEACLDYAKKCVDELACGGGWIFAFDKGLSFKCDAKQENLEAVVDYIHNVRA